MDASVTNFHVSADELKKDSTYFMVSFFDNDLLIPEITTVIYLGKDIFGEGDGSHYFRDYSAVAEADSATANAVIEAEEGRLDNFFAIGGLVQLLQDCQKRRQRRRA